MYALVLRRRPKVISQENDQVIEDAFAQRACARERWIVPTPDEGCPNLFDEAVVERKDRKRDPPKIDEVPNLHFSVERAVLGQDRLGDSTPVFAPLLLNLRLP